MKFCWDARALTAASTEASTQQDRRCQQQQHGKENTEEQMIWQYIVYLSQYQVLVCKEHKTVVQNLDVHLRDQHSVPSKERKEFIKSCAYLAIKKPGDIELPPPLEWPLKELGEPLDGIRRTQTRCNFLTISKSAMRMHCNKAHKLPFKSDTSTLYRKVKLQTFFRTGGLQRYFIVEAHSHDSDQ